ncbi:helix-turn-helix domain-containing protein [Microbacterium sp. zg-YB36]|uniref:helix-turn-helix domain-containing protein n=1 Tax=Microbacterium sp. zg-YB36 TaxID=2969407 RepID=UPI00214AC379|nr:helix-turn-helix domain-containing protein [Microbacterium sp. zg-YB36]MDL5351015.1 helix-turn-helix domain-containing protein [Microbacterium sp. zg-YB36]
MAELALRFRLDAVQQAWDGFQAGLFASEVGEQIGVDRTTAKRMLVAAGGVRPRHGRDLQGRYLSFAEREEIAVGVARGESVRAIAKRLGRAPSTVSRELSRNPVRGRYRASMAQMTAMGRACRPKPAKPATNLRLRERVEQDLAKRRPPEQIAGRLRRELPDDPEMQVSVETIYQSLYVQSRGALKQKLTRHLRTGRGLASSQSEGRAAQEPDPQHGQHLGATADGE